MKTTPIYLLIFLPVLFMHCTDDEGIDRNLYEGELIPGTEVFFPMGYLGGPQLLPKVSPDGRYLAYQNFYADGQTQGLWILDMQTGEKRLLIEGGYAPDWSPDGEWIAFNLGTQIFKIKVNGDSITPLTESGSNFMPDWSPDGEYLLYDNINCGSQVKPAPENSCGVLLIDKLGHKKTLISPGRFPKWFNDQEKFLSSSGIIYNVDGTDILNLHFEKGYRSADISEEDKVIFQNDDGIYLIDLGDPKIMKLLGHDQNQLRFPSRIKRLVCCPSWYPDGEHIVYQRFEVTDAQRGIDGTEVEGYLAFYNLNVDSAMTNFK